MIWDLAKLAVAAGDLPARLVADRTTTRGPLTGRPRGPMETRPADAGLFGPGSAAWRLHREAMLLLGAGPRALLMQLAHPAVAAGVAEHSDFRADPWRRLDGTFRSYLRIVFGTTVAARDEVRRLNRIHRAIRGTGYAATDPELALWVHATLVDSTMAVNDAWNGPLDRDRAARFHDEMRPIGRAFGIPDAMLPADLDAFGRTSPTRSDRMGRPGRGHGAGAGVGRAAPATPRGAGTVPLDPRLHGWTLWPAIGLLPPRIRRGYGLPWTLAIARPRGWSPAGARGTGSCHRPGARCRRPVPPRRAPPGRRPGPPDVSTSAGTAAGTWRDRSTEVASSSAHSRSMCSISRLRSSATYSRIARQNSVEPIRFRASSMRLPPWM